MIGLIPAHAGSTLIMTTSVCGLWAHPRSRGEHVHPVERESGDAGSSPLTRGARVYRHVC